MIETKKRKNTHAPGMAPRVRDSWGGGVKANLTNTHRSMLRFDQLESVSVEVWPTRVGQCWGLTNLSRSMLRFDHLELVSVEVWPTRDGQCWGLNNSSRSMLRFDQLEPISVEVWPTQDGQCWGLNNSNQSMLRYDQLESVNIEVWPTWILLLNKILALAIFDGPTQSGLDQLSQQHWRVTPSSLVGAIPDTHNLISTHTHTHKYAKIQTQNITHSTHSLLPLRLSCCPHQPVTTPPPPYCTRTSIPRGSHWFINPNLILGVRVDPLWSRKCL